MAECLELSCVSVKMVLFLWDLCPLRAASQEQKLKHTDECRGNNLAKGCSAIARPRLLSKPNLILGPHHLPTLFSFGGTLALPWRKAVASL